MTAPLSNPRKGLSIAQSAAVNAALPTTVLAAAGTGKTTTIVHRIAKAKITDGLSLDTMFMTTFTRKAAQEMIDRIGKLLQSAPKYAGTFHRNALLLIKEHPVLLTIHGYDSTFTMLDSTDIDRLLTDALKPYKQQLKSMGINAKMAKKWIHAGIDALKSNGIYPLDLHMTPTDLTPENIECHTKKFQDIPSSIAHGVYLAFQTELKRMSALDFNDIISLPTLAMRDTQICEKVNKNFRLVVVDEFQDCSKLQLELANQISNNGKYLYLVGDEDQLIYGWRDASLAQVMEAYQSTNTLLLETNYRSQKNIVSLAASVITQNTMRSDKVMNAYKPSAAPVKNIIPYDTRQEASYVVQEITRLIARGVTPNEIAIISRTNDYFMMLEAELLTNRIDYNVVKAYNFFEYKEVKDIVSYLRLAVDHNNDLAFKRIINTPKRKNGLKAVNKIEAKAHMEQSSLFTALHNQAGVSASNEAFVSIILNLGQMMADDKPVKRVIHHLLDTLNYEQYLYEEHGVLEGEIRFERVKKLALIIDMMLEEYGVYPETLAALNDEMANMKKEPDEKKVQLMTIHGSKGLEFERMCSLLVL